MLKRIRAFIGQHGDDIRAAAAICNALHNLKAREHALVSQLERLRTVGLQMEKCDLSQYAHLQQTFQHLTKEQQARCRELFVQEREKMGLEDAISRFVEGFKRYSAEFDRAVDGVCAAVSEGATREAVAWIDKALDQERQAEGLMGGIRGTEKRLLKVLGRQIATLASEARRQ